MNSFGELVSQTLHQGNARDQELMRLKGKLAKVEQERDFLKETGAYFAKESK